MLYANPADSPDGTFATARPLALNQAQSQDFDELLDLYDVFSFDLNALTLVTVTLSNIPAANNLDIFVYNANKLLWGTGDNPGNLDESVSLTLSAGRYYVMVQRFSGLPQPGNNYQILVED
jgi:hypothetical protein